MRFRLNQYLVLARIAFTAPLVVLGLALAIRADCPQPAAWGQQPYPATLVPVFEKAGTNRLGSQAPDSVPIRAGYPEQTMETSYVPCILLKAMAAVEVGDWNRWWYHFGVDNYGEWGYTTMGYDPGGSCGYGLMQITSGMGGSQGTDEFDPGRVAAEPAYNVGAAVHMLVHSKWNYLTNPTPPPIRAIGNNDPRVAENWYYAVWAYNYWGWTNNPNNPVFTRGGTPWAHFACYQDRTQDVFDWPYQERVWGCAWYPPPGLGYNQVLLSEPPRDQLQEPLPISIDTPRPSHGSCTVRYAPGVFKN